MQFWVGPVVQQLLFYLSVASLCYLHPEAHFPALLAALQNMPYILNPSSLTLSQLPVKPKNKVLLVLSLYLAAALVSLLRSQPETGDMY